mgnify:FL=1
MSKSEKELVGSAFAIQVLPFHFHVWFAAPATQTKDGELPQTAMRAVLPGIVDVVTCPQAAPSQWSIVPFWPAIQASLGPLAHTADRWVVPAGDEKAHQFDVEQAR